MQYSLCLVDSSLLYLSADHIQQWTSRVKAMACESMSLD